MSRPVERPRGGLWRTEIVRAVLNGHSVLGIAFAAAIYIVCLSGTLSVFVRDFERWEQPVAPTFPVASDAAIGRAVAEMGNRAGANRNFYVLLPSDDFPRLLLSSGNDAAGEAWYADANGHLTTRAKSPWTDFLVDLHTRLHLPQTLGRFLVGLTGVALLSSLISGILAHPRIFRDAFHLRLGGSRRLEQADLHNRLGVWPLPFHVIVSLTGALLGLSTVIVGILALLVFRGDSQQVYALLAPPPAREDARPVPMPDVAGLIAMARERAPGAQLRQIEVSHWSRGDMRLELSASRPRLIAQQDSITFDAAGRIVAEKRPAGLTVGERILGALGQLHFGWFGGSAVRVAYGLLGLALCVVTASGITIWLARRRDKGRAAPAWERLWAAICWGQPVAMATTVALALLAHGRMPDGTLVTVWAAVTLLSAIIASALASRSAADLARVGRCATGLLLLGAAGIHATISMRGATDLGGFAVDGAIVMIAIVLLRSICPRRLIPAPNR